MTTFDKRKDAFESKFAEDEEMKFKAAARRNRLLGQWAAALLGKSGADSARRATQGLVYFCLFQIAFVVATSSAFSAIESARYRYAAEPMIWLVIAFSVVAIFRRGTSLPSP